jgi:hypothetical protein
MHAINGSDKTSKNKSMVTLEENPLPDLFFKKKKEGR